MLSALLLTAEGEGGEGLEGKVLGLAGNSGTACL